MGVAGFRKVIAEEGAMALSTGIGSAAGAEFIADCFLCPLEAARIRAVSNPEYGNGLVGVASRLLREEGVIKGFYAGMGTSPDKCGSGLNTGVSLGSGVVAGVASAI